MMVESMKTVGGMNVGVRLLIAFVTLSLVFSKRVTAADPPNVLFLVSDDQRPDTIAALGNAAIQTPNLDRLVHRGSVFSNAICANPICSPSRAEILTGCTGMRNGVFDFGRTIDPALPTLPEPFHEAGYATWYTGKWHNNGRPSLHGYANTAGLFTSGGARWWKEQSDYRGQPITGYKGWVFRDTNDKVQPQHGVGLTPNISARFADAAIEVIRGATKPFFLHVNFTAPHDPLLIPPGYEDRYDPSKIPLPKNFRDNHPFDHGNKGGRDEVLLPIPRTEADVRGDIAAYYAVITHLDAQVGRILNALDVAGKTDSTIVVFTSDHGLAMGSHGLRGKQNMYEHTIRVPLIFAGPKVPRSKTFKGHAYLRDIFPTVCDLAGIDPPSDLDGKSQLPVMLGAKESMYNFSIGYFRDSQRMIRTDRWKLIEYPVAKRTQLFDLANDQDELNDLSDSHRHAEIRQDLALRLKRWQRESIRQTSATD